MRSRPQPEPNPNPVTPPAREDTYARVRRVLDEALAELELMRDEEERLLAR